MSEFLSHLRSLDVRLWLEGDRLRYSAPPGVMTPELTRELVERKPEIMSFLERVGQMSQVPSPSIVRSSRNEPLPLSYAQERLWVFDRLNPNSPAYNIAGAVRLKGRLDLFALERAFNEIIKRHEVLRTRFVIVDGQPKQNVLPDLQLQIPILDIGEVPAANRESEVQRLATEEARQPFDLSTGPLLRMKIVKLGAEEHVLLVNTHHIVSDGWSIGVLVQEFAHFYEAFVSDKSPRLPPLPAQHADFAVEQRRWLQGEVLEKQLSYWKTRLAGTLQVLDMPTDRPRPAVQTFNGAREHSSFPKTLTSSIYQLCERHDATLFMVLLAAFELLLYRYTGQDDILIGTPIANRTRAEVEGLIGYFANTLVLRADVSGDPSFLELLKRVREEALGAYSHQDLPLELLIEELQPPRDVSRSALFQVAFVLQNTPSQELTLRGLTLTTVPLETGTSKFDLTLDIAEVNEGLALAVEYNTDLFNASSIARLLEHYQTLLQSMVEAPEQPLSKLSMLTEQEYSLQIDRACAGASYEAHACLHELFEAQVRRRSEATALVFEDTRLTYDQLNRRANQLAHHLRALGVQSETLIGVYMERSIELVVGVLAILKAGGAYVPLDPAYPTQRLALILEDARASVILTQQDLLETLPPHGARVLCLDTVAEAINRESEQNPSQHAMPANLAYVIYTSGSTGKPKGTLITHANVVRLFEATSSWFNFDERDVWTLFHSYAFDFSVWELWGALLYGGRLVVISYSVSRSPEAFRDLLAKEQVSVLNQTPSAFRQLMRQEESLPDAPKLTNVRLVIFGGEALAMGSLRPWFERYGDQRPELINMYGTTETTVHVTYRPLNIADVAAAGKSYIGASIPDLEVYLLDQYLRPVPIGVPGEIHVGGAGLARGYLNLPDLTSQRFVPHSFSRQPGARLYKSGDLGRYLSNGDIEYLGRIDLQVKIRGFRIELGEIESVLRQHEAVREAAVIAREYGDEKRLTAYIVFSPGSHIDVTELRSSLKERLPEYMVPSHFVSLENLPLTAHGKLDSRSLPEAETDRPHLGEAYTAPRTATESTLAGIWEETLGISRVGVHDNFFDLGGDSIRSIQVHAKARARGLKFPLHQLFRHSTIAEIAQDVSSEDAAHEEDLQPLKIERLSLISEADRDRLPRDVEDAYPLAMLQAGMLFHSEYHPDSAVYHNITTIRLKARFDERVLRNSLQHLASRHPVLRTSFDLTNYGQPLQIVHRNVVLPLEVDDLRSLSLSEQDEAIAAWFEGEKGRPFDWTCAPLIRFRVHLRSDESFQLSWTEHHAILDGWSVASMITELFKIYFDSLGEASLPLEPPPAASFRDFVALEKNVISSEQNHKFWLERLNGSEPTVIPRWPPAYRSETKQGSIQVSIPDSVSDALKKLSRAAGVPLKSVLLAAHLSVLSLLSGQQDVTTGLILNGRLEESDGDRVLGLFLNTVPFRLDLRGGDWQELVKQAFAAEQEIMPFRRFPLAEMQRLKGGQSLFVTTFNFINFHIYQSLNSLQNVEFLDAKVFADTNYALKATFGLDLLTSNVQLELGYLLPEFTEDQIKSIGEYYSCTLSAMATDPSASYATFSPLSSEERQRQLVEWNDTGEDYGPDVCIHQLFEAQVERTPEKAAVTFEGRSLTYAQLNRRANQLAHHLRSLGVEKEVLVGLYTKRSLETVIGALAVLKAGAAYAPFDPQHPPERLAYMIADARARVVLTQKALAENLSEYAVQVIVLDNETNGEDDRNPGSGVTARNAAYVIYTSGSTGVPKAVVVEHHSLVNYVRGICRELHLENGFQFAMVQPLTVDASLTALFPTLVTGGCVHIISEERIGNPELLSEYFDQHSVDGLKIAPTHLAALLAWVEPRRLVPKHWLVLGGEAPPADLLATLQAADCRVLNQYGPTEATVAMLTCRLDNASDGPTPIGRPLPNTLAYLLDKHLQPVPVGVAGELYIGGDCLARGYLNRPGLTAEGFIPNPFSSAPGSRLYKTGDAARYLPDGTVVFVGRFDDQVKIHGYRIELGEVAAVLGRHPQVREVTVLTRAGARGEQTIVAYVVSDQQAMLKDTDLRMFLGEKLPEYMVPSAFVMLDSLPRTPHGKLDRKALPEPEVRAAEQVEQHLPPRDFFELQLIRIWESVLKVSPIGARDNFFDLGGHSILALHLVAHIQKQFAQSISLAELLQHPTVEQMAVLLRSQAESKTASPLVAIQSTGSKLPFFCVHAVGGEVLSYVALAQELGRDQPFYGLQAVHPNGRNEPLARIEEMAAFYIEAIREVQPHGPYLLGGWSMGGAIAFEMAQQLRKQDEQVALLILIDSHLDGDSAEVAGENAGILLRFFADFFALAGKELTGSLDELKQLSEEELLNYFLEQARNANILLPGVEVSELQSLFRVFKANRCALRTYVPASYRGSVVLFQASDGPRPPIEPSESWRKLAEQLEVEVVPGDHYQIVTKPHVQILAERLKPYLEKIQQTAHSFA